MNRLATNFELVNVSDILWEPWHVEFYDRYPRPKSAYQECLDRIELLEHELGMCDTWECRRCELLRDNNYRYNEYWNGK